MENISISFTINHINQEMKTIQCKIFGCKLHGCFTMISLHFSSPICFLHCNANICFGKAKKNGKTVINIWSTLWEMEA